ncbi:hypothetical protein HGP28_13005 [Vibrio sp. SM6]|uniref:Lipoprotein n=1 Tax=Vibrio agarilyticus TaxID=2726741 RepID=A0A7X8YHP6_9VIBR|nr:hypothetical protein [Vibrio agarilyticus]NLS13810.1 hypothetical protein [Vibrio agarilyticus]
MLNTLTLYKITLISLCSAVLLGCGGGGSGGGGTASAPATPPAAISTTPQTVEEIVVPDGFSYHPVSEYQLDLDISAISNERAFVSVYTHYTEVDGNLRADYASRVVAAPLHNGTISMPFSAANAEQDLLIEIWFYNDSAPLQKRHSTQTATITW